MQSRWLSKRTSIVCWTPPISCGTGPSSEIDASYSVGGCGGPGHSRSTAAGDGSSTGTTSTATGRSEQHLLDRRELARRHVGQLELAVQLLDVEAGVVRERADAHPAAEPLVAERLSLPLLA